MNGIGLVFAGGGGKGAYEIGVWKYLHEIGLDRYVRCVSGTSVGALNAALFVGSTYECAENLWLNIREYKILASRKITDIATDVITNTVDATSFLMKTQLFPYGTGLLTNPFVMDGVDLVKVIGEKKITKTLLKKSEEEYETSRKEKNCVYSREGIIDMISESLDFDKLKTSEISCYATCFKCEEGEMWKAERFRLNDYSPENITTLLLASSAMPILFSNEKFNGNNYCDGGVPVFGDNIPIEPVYDAEVEYIIVVRLNKKTVIEDVIEKMKYPNAKIIEIIPSRDLRKLFKGTLDFSSEGAQKRLNLGYEDAKKYRELQEIIRIFER